MLQAYYGGATGVLVSGLVWLIASIAGVFHTPTTSMIVLLVGGMFIFPISVLFSKILGLSGKHSEQNVLSHLAFEGLGILFCGIFLAFTLFHINPQLFFPVMLLTIGARYLTFQTLYGLKVYWIFGAVLITGGFISMISSLPFIVGAFIGGIVELIFALFIFSQSKRHM